MKEEFFSGSKENLVKYWQNSERARKFINGGTRAKAVSFILEKERNRINMDSWLDVAIGAGYIQSVAKANSRLIVGADLSQQMLGLISDSEIQKVACTFQSLPFRSDSFSYLSSFFSLSDYPDLETNILSIFSIGEINSEFLYVDYSIGDEYWMMRKTQHGKNGIVGNINLRQVDAIRSWFVRSDRLQVIHSETIETEESTEKFLSQYPILPKSITRRFIYLKLRKVKSK